MKYYLCEYETHRALREFETSQEVVDYINSSEYPYLFCNMSRHALSKDGTYPRNKKGDDLLSLDVSKKYYIVESKFPVLKYE
jgi:hypothetical protein